MLGLALALTVGWLAAAIIGDDSPLGDGGESAAARDLPPGWVTLEPLLPLAPGLKEISALKRSAAGGASRVLGESASGDEGAIRLRALPQGGGEPAQPDPAGTGAVMRPEPTSRLRAAGVSLGVVPAVRRIVDSRELVRRPRILGDLEAIIDRDLAGLPSGPSGGGGVGTPPVDPLPGGVPRPRIEIPAIEIPPIDPVPGVGPVPGINPRPGDGGSLLPGGGPLDGRPVPQPSLPINVTIGDLRADPRFDALLVSSGRRVLERYVFRDRDIAGLSAQVNLRSRLLTADVLRDQAPLAYVAAAPLREGGADAADRRSGAERGGKGRSDRGAAGARGGGGSGSAGDRGDGPRSRGRRSGGDSSRGASPGSSKGSPKRARSGSRAARPSRGRARPRRSSNRGSARGRDRPSRGGGSKPRDRGSSRGGGGDDDDDDDGDDDDDDDDEDEDDDD